MIIQQGDTFDYTLNNGMPATIEVTSTVGDKVQYKHIHGKSGKGVMREDYFRQMIDSGYLKKE